MTNPDRNSLTFPWVEGEHYEIDRATGCWNWTLKLTHQGYGRVDLNRVRRLSGTQYAHRAGYVAIHGRLDRTVDVHHRCENILCVNPDHLEAIPHKAHLRRHKRAGSPFTEGDIIAMRQASWVLGQSTHEIGARYNIHPTMVGLIARGRRWPDTPGPLSGHCRSCGAEITRVGKRYCNSTCQSAWHREQERQTAEHQCEKCHRAATNILRGSHLCGYHCKKHWNDPELIRLGSIYAAGRAREARRIPA